MSKVTFVPLLCCFGGALAADGDADKNVVYLTGQLDHVSVTAPGPAQRVSFHIRTTAPYAFDIEVICDGDYYYTLACTSFVGRDDVIGARMEFVGQLVSNHYTHELEFHITREPVILDKPDKCIDASDADGVSCRG